MAEGIGKYGIHPKFKGYQGNPDRDKWPHPGEIRRMPEKKVQKAKEA